VTFYINLQNSENIHLDKIMKLLTIIYFIFTATMNADEPFNIEQVNIRIEALVARKAHLTNSALSVEARNTNPDFIAIKNSMRTSWPQVFDKWDLIANGTDGKRLIIEALQILESADYMSALEALVARYENGSMSEELLKNVLSPMGRMAHFLTDNYNHPRVVLVLNRIKVKSTNVALKNEIGDTLSGANKVMRDNFREAHAGMPEGNTPIVILPP
jgi:hypothetical protein